MIHTGTYTIIDNGSKRGCLRRKAIRAHHAGEESFEVVERDDGFVGPPGDPELYFSRSDEWDPRECAGMDRAEGRVLDVGCGAGRHALYLQELDHEVVGVGTSPGT